MLKLKSKMNKSQVIAVLFLITSFSVFGQKKEWNTLNEIEKVEKKYLHYY